MNTLSTKQIDALNALIFDEYGCISSFYQRLAEISLAYSSMYMAIVEDNGDIRGSVNDLHMLGELMKVFAKD
ncbi:hypothetical protein [Dysgonomonas macrotermitis]|uniref:Uncharacterized protein n=1 Tax=Dysgonomonas macrotermitis TaxID=1346286 RepID=A0A1M5GKI2_9BACT|nr:hypothetical protein [Dysgonomonas macrotermitis]SHG04260.1 hypothetical protein SAMN05444362_11447 [Dysgonomonas macrotermitis]